MDQRLQPKRPFNLRALCNDEAGRLIRIYHVNDLYKNKMYRVLFYSVCCVSFTVDNTQCGFPNKHKNSVSPFVMPMRFHSHSAPHRIRNAQ